MASSWRPSPLSTKLEPYSIIKLFGSFSSVELLFSLGSMLSQVFIAVTVHLLLVFPSGRFESRADRLIAAGAYFAAGALYVGAFAFADRQTLSAPSVPGTRSS